MKNVNIELLVPESTKELHISDWELIVSVACARSGLKVRDKKHKVNLQGFNDSWHNEVECREISTIRFFSSLVARTYDYRNLGLGSFRGGSVKLYSPRIIGWDIFNCDRTSLSRIKDYYLRLLITSFYESLRDYPQEKMSTTLGNNVNHPEYKKMNGLIPDFELFFGIPYKEYRRRIQDKVGRVKDA